MNAAANILLISLIWAEFTGNPTMERQQPVGWDGQSSTESTGIAPTCLLWYCRGLESTAKSDRAAARPESETT